MRYNIEVKSSDREGECVDWPEYHAFVDKCFEVFRNAGIRDRLIVQCFDVRALEYMHEKYPDYTLAYLVGPKAGSYDQYMPKLSFKPQWLSPYYKLVDEALVARCRAEGIKLVPWTPDEDEDLQRLVDLGVEAIITNRPDRLLKITRGY